MDFNVFDSTTQVKIDVVFCNNDTRCINEKKKSAINQEEKKGSIRV